MIHKLKRHGRALPAEAGKNLLSWATPGNADVKEVDWRDRPYLSGVTQRQLHGRHPSDRRGSDGIYEYKRVGLRLGCPARYVLPG